MPPDKGAKYVESPTIDGLYSRYRLPLLQIIGRYVRCPAEREDVLHDVFLRVHRALPGFRGDSALFTWLYRIAVNTSLNYIRRKSFRLADETVSVEQLELEVSSADDPELLASAQQCQERMEAVMKQLGWANKDAYLLYSKTGLSYDSIARLLGCPVGTVRSRIARTRSNLKAVLGNQLEVEL